MLIPSLLRPTFNFIVKPFMPMYVAWIPIAMAAASAVQSGVQTSSANRAGKAAAADAQEAYDLESELKRGAVAAQTNSLVASKTEAQDRAVANMSEMTRQAMITRGRIAATSGEAGVAGSSVASLFLTSYFEEARARGQEIYNLDKFNKQVNRDIRGVQTGLQIGSRPAGYNSTGTAIKFAGSLLSIGKGLYDTYGPATGGGVPAPNASNVPNKT